MAGYNMQWDNDYDVKEYRPKKKNKSGTALPVLPGMDNAASTLAGYAPEPDGGVMLTTSEILDFSEGTDSY